MMTRCRHSGFSLVAALFVIVAVMLAAVAMVSTTLSRSSSTVLSLRASQTLYAAQGGLQIAIAQVLAGGCAAVSASVELDGISVDLTCTASAIDEGASTYAAYALQARAYQGSLADNSFVSRRLQAMVSDAP